MPRPHRTRRSALRRRLSRGAFVAFAAIVAVIAVGPVDVRPAQAQEVLTFPLRPKPTPRRPAQRTGAQEQMLVRAAEINYDYTNERVAAVGNVQIYYGDTTLEADRVIYDQKTKRLHAEGNVRLTQPDGTVTLGNIMDLGDDLRDGFVDSLQARGTRADPLRGHARRAVERQLHCLPERRLHRLRAVQGRSHEAAEMAGQGRPHHP